MDADHVVVWRGWYTVDGVDSDVVRRLAIQDRATTVEEDIRLVESVQRGMKSRGYKPGPLVIDPACGLNSEHSVTLQQWMREAANEGLRQIASTSSYWQNFIDGDFCRWRCGPARRG
jgi:phenylpropionate dioxygenase-like ring-hydroxylating dioxygenase large terminal subunit